MKPHYSTHQPFPFERHVFVCTNDREDGHPKGCCQSRGGQDVVKAFKTEVIKRGLKDKVRAQRAGCLAACEYGVTVTVYPDNIWYGMVTPQDVPEIVESHLLQGKVVERLLIPGKHPQHNASQ